MCVKRLEHHWQECNVFLGCNQIKNDKGCQNCQAIYGMKKNTVAFNKHDLKKLYDTTQKTFYFGGYGDVLNVGVDHNHLKQLIQAMNENQQHEYVIVTKRPARLKHFFDCGIGMPNNLKLGVAVSTQEEYNIRLPQLLDVPVKHHFLIIEHAAHNIIYLKRVSDYCMLDAVYIGNCLIKPRKILEMINPCFSYINLIETIFYGEDGGRIKKFFSKLNTAAAKNIRIIAPMKQ